MVEDVQDVGEEVVGAEGVIYTICSRSLPMLKDEWCEGPITSSIMNAGQLPSLSYILWHVPSRNTARYNTAITMYI